MTQLPQKTAGKYANVDVTNFTSAHRMTRADLLLMAEIAESRGLFEVSARWLLAANGDAMRQSQAENTEQARQREAQKYQPPAGRVAAATTFSRSERLPVSDDILGTEAVKEKMVAGDARARAAQVKADEEMERQGRILAAQAERMMNAQQL